MDTFVNLHVHSLFSKQDSVIKIDELVQKVKEYGQDTVALTDHSSTAGHYYFKKECEKQKIKPIFGNEFYTNISYTNKTRNRNHLLCLALNNKGLININKLQNIAVHNSYYKPIISYEILPEYTEGIFATSACSLGSISQMILENKIDEAKDYCNWFSHIFNENFALELQMHPLYENQYKINNILVELSEELSIPLVVTSDAHFLTEEDSDTRRVIQAIAWKKAYNDVNDSLPSNCLGNSDIIFKNAELSGFDKDIIKSAIKNTRKIADRCNASLCSTDRKVPIFDKFEEFDELFEKVL